MTIDHWSVHKLLCLQNWNQYLFVEQHFLLIELNNVLKVRTKLLVYAQKLAKSHCFHKLIWEIILWNRITNANQQFFKVFIK